MRKIDEIEKNLAANSDSNGLMHSKEFRDHAKEKQNDGIRQSVNDMLLRSMAKGKEEARKEQEKAMLEKERIQREKDAEQRSVRSNNMALLALIVAVISLLIQVIK